jgi:hypothetical protein
VRIVKFDLDWLLLHRHQIWAEANVYEMADESFGMGASAAAVSASEAGFF